MKCVQCGLKVPVVRRDKDWKGWRKSPSTGRWICPNCYSELKDPECKPDLCMDIKLLNDYYLPFEPVKMSVFDWVTTEILELKNLGESRGWLYPAEFGRKTALVEVRNRMKREIGGAT